MKAIHLNQNKFQCGFCLKQFLNQHLLLHTSDTDVKCDFCTLSFLNTKDLYNHQLECHPDQV